MVTLGNFWEASSRLPSPEFTKELTSWRVGRGTDWGIQGTERDKQGQDSTGKEREGEGRRGKEREGEGRRGKEG